MNGIHYKIVCQVGVFLLYLSSRTAMAAGVKHSDTTNGVYSEFILDREGYLASSNKIEFSFVRDTNSEPTTIVFLKKEFLCQMQLTDEQGNNVPFTSFGENFGARFLQISNYSPEVIQRVPFKYWITRRQGNEVETLPAPEELFQIAKPGHYTLRLQLQVIEHYKGPSSGRFESSRLLRIPTVEIPVNKE
jgi:hypothetical protein